MFVAKKNVLEYPALEAYTALDLRLASRLTSVREPTSCTGGFRRFGETKHQ